MAKKLVFNWSGGKDSAYALHTLLQSDEYEIVSLLTTLNSSTRRSSMHGIPEGLLQKQADSIGLPLYVIAYAPEAEIQGYEACMLRAVEHFKNCGVNHFAFGDIFLHDVRAYREKNLLPHGIEVVEPLWDMGSDAVLQGFLQSGLQTVVVTVTANCLDASYVGRLVNQQFCNDLPKGVDPLGENGEYHTFCFDGPIFTKPIAFSMGTPLHFSHTFKLEDGTEKTYDYWCANIGEAVE